MPRFFRYNGLSIVLFVLFALSFTGQVATGFREHNEDQKEHHQAPVTFGKYLTSGHFIEATFENWESEFLQMAAYVVLTIFLYQKGSSESKKPDTISRVDIIPESARDKPDTPAPVKRGGWQLKLYQNSLTIALLMLFAMSFVLHGVGGAREYNQDQIEHNEPTVSTMEYMESSRFWFESFQNWQSEFLSIGMMVVLSIYLRQKGSPESKPVDSPHDDTGSD